jgi:4-hydroxybenzoyl-CoA reductase subunit beta
MRLPKFQYAEPASLKEISAILLKEPGAKILAGGTDILPNMKHRVELPSVVVNIKKIPELDLIERHNGAVRIGTLAPLKKVYESPIVAENLSALVSACSSVGSYHHQVMGTVGGNICQQNRCWFFNQSQWWRSCRPTCYKAGGEICHVVNQKEICYAGYCGDVAPVLLALDARLVINGPEGSREIALEDLFSGDGKAPLKLHPGEILTEILIPANALDGVSSYKKFANRDSIDFPIVGTAFWASSQNKTYRIAFTAVDRQPIRAHQIEAFLNGKDLSPENIAAACDLAVRAAKPVKNSVYSPAFKRRMMGLLLKEAVSQAMRRLSL